MINKIKSFFKKRSKNISRPKIIFLAKEDFLEEQILSDINYDWKKHFLFELPSILSFILKMSVIWFFLNTFAYQFAISLYEFLKNHPQ